MNDEDLRFLPRELATGVRELDTQHEALFARLKDLKDHCLNSGHLSDNEAEGLLAALREHYATEERLAAEIGLEFSEHARQHKVMLIAVTKTFNEVIEGRANVFSLLRYLDYWFERHIADEDMVLGDQAIALRSQRPGTHLSERAESMAA